MYFIYNFILLILYPILFLIYLFSKKFRNFINIRKFEKLKYKNLNLNSKVIWLHAASVGELDQCKALAKIIKTYEKNRIILQTVFSESVKENNYDSVNTDYTIHLPLDFYFSYNWIYKIFKPEKLIIMAWDTWINLIYTAKKNNLKIYLACATWDENSKRRNYFIKSFTKKLFQNFDGISPVAEFMVPLYNEFLENKVKIISCGDNRFDSVIEKIESKKIDNNFEKNIKELEYSNVLILASTYESCEKIIFPLINELIEKNFQIWIFPHKINESRILEIETNLNKLQISFIRYSNQNFSKNFKVVLFDQLGLLAFAYKYGKIAYIGGALHNKIHNVLEPAYFGLPLISGKNLKNSYDAVYFHKNNTLEIIQTSFEFKNSIYKFSDNSEYFRISQFNKNYVFSKKGSSENFYKTFIMQEQ